MAGRFITLLSASIMLTAVISGTANFSLSGPPMFLSGGEGHELGPDENGTFLSGRGPGAEPRKEPVSNYGTTSKVFEFDDTSGIDVSRSISVCGGNLTICRRDRRFSVVSDVDPGSEPFATPTHDLAQGGDTLVQGYVVKRSGVYEYMVRSSSDAGGEWTAPFPVIESITRNIVAELEVWGDICILAISYIPDGHGFRPRMEVREGPLSNLTRLTGEPSLELNNVRVRDLVMTCTDDRIDLIYKEDNEKPITNYRRYRGEGWQPPSSVPDTKSAEEFSITCSGQGTMVIYAIPDPITPSAGRVINHAVTMDGTSWEGASLPLNTTPLPLSLRSVFFGGKAVVMVLSEGRLNASATTDLGGNWSGQAPIAVNVSTFGLSVVDNTTLMAVHTSNGSLACSVSQDAVGWKEYAPDMTGCRWNLTAPVMPERGEFVSFAVEEKDRHDICSFDLRDYESEGKVLLRGISPPAVSSWSAVGLNAALFPTTRILLEVGTLEGVAACNISLEELEEGEVNGRSYLRCLWLDGLFAGSPTDGIAISMTFQGSGLFTPSVGSIEVDYRVGFPFFEDLEDLDNVLTCSAEHVNGSLVFARGDTLTIEPVEAEVGFPDHLLIESPAGEVPEGFGAELLDARDGSPISGYSCHVWTLPAAGNRSIVRWVGGFLRDIDHGVPAVMIRFGLTGPEGVAPFILQGFGLFYDSPPVVSGMVTGRPSVHRNEMALLGLEGADDLQDLKDLDVVVEHMGPDTSDWSSTHIMNLSGPLTWGFLPPSDSPVGLWRLRAVISDLSQGEPVYCLASMEVKNNPPIPPEIDLIPSEPRTTDEIHVNLVSQGYDLETPSDDLIYRYLWYRNGELVVEGTQNLSGGIDLPSERTRKGEVWSVGISTFDGINESGYVREEVRIMNSPPVFLGGSLLEIDMIEDMPIQLDLGPDLFDADGDDLGLEFHLGPNVDPEIDGYRVMLVPDANWNGEARGILLVNDGETNTLVNVLVRVGPVNDPPEGVEIIHPANGTARCEGIPWALTGAFFDADGEEMVTTRWYLDGDMIGAGSRLSEVYLPVGTHELVFEVDDGIFPPVRASVFVIIEEFKGDNGTESGGVEKADTGPKEKDLISDQEALAVITLLVMIILMLLTYLFVVTFRRRRKRGPAVHSRIPVERGLPAASVRGKTRHRLPPTPEELKRLKEQKGPVNGAVRREYVVVDGRTEEYIHPTKGNPYFDHFEEDTHTYYGPYVWPKDLFSDEKKYVNGKKGDL